MVGEGCDGQGEVPSIAVDPACCNSADVALFALRFLYTGKFKCSFESDIELLLQLLRLCARYGLPASLQRWALDRLLDLSDDPSWNVAAAALIHETQRIHMRPSDRIFVAWRVVVRDCHWYSIDRTQ